MAVTKLIRAVILRFSSLCLIILIIAIAVKVSGLGKANALGVSVGGISIGTGGVNTGLGGPNGAGNAPTIQAPIVGNDKGSGSNRHYPVREHFVFLILNFGATAPIHCDKIKIPVPGARTYDIVGVGTSLELANDPITVIDAKVSAPDEVLLKRCNFDDKRSARQYLDQLINIDVWTPQAYESETEPIQK